MSETWVNCKQSYYLPCFWERGYNTQKGELKENIISYVVEDMKLIIFRKLAGQYNILVIYIMIYITVTLHTLQWAIHFLSVYCKVVD